MATSTPLKDLLNKLDGALILVDEKRTAMDKAQESLNHASAEYDKAVTAAVNVRNEVDNRMATILPSSSHVRQSV